LPREIESDTGPANEDPSDDDVSLSDDEDLGEEEEESDEYDLDDRLLAREIALDAHNRQAYSLIRNAEELSEEAEVEAYDRSLGLGPSGDAGGLHPADGRGRNDRRSEEGDVRNGREGGVMLALPAVVSRDSSGRPVIINPSPDDIRRYVRVGKLDNGNLVLAPGERGWSDTDDDTEDEGRMEGRRRKREVKRRLMGDEGLDGVGHTGSMGFTGVRRDTDDIARTAGRGGELKAEAAAEGGGTQRGRGRGEERGLPPKIGTTTTVREGTTAKQKPSGEEMAEMPMKMSRFKAARMGMQ